MAMPVTEKYFMYECREREIYIIYKHSTGKDLEWGESESINVQQNQSPLTTHHDDGGFI